MVFSSASSSCPYQRCFPANILTLPKSSSPKIVSSAVASGAEFNPKSRAAWTTIAENDMDARRALQNATCCFEKGKSGGGGPQICYLADSEEKGIRLPSGCQRIDTFNPSECVCKTKGPRRLYCGNAPITGAVQDCDETLRLGEPIECRRNGIVVGLSNTLETNIPKGCRFEDTGKHIC